MANRPTVAYAERITREFNRDKRNADKLARKPRLAEIHAISKNVTKNIALATVSLNDILEAYDSTMLLRDPRFRDRLRELSRRLNSV